MSVVIVIIIDTSDNANVKVSCPLYELYLNPDKIFIGLLKWANFHIRFIYVNLRFFGTVSMNTTSVNAEPPIADVTK